MADLQSYQPGPLSSSPPTESFPTLVVDIEPSVQRHGGISSHTPLSPVAMMALMKNVICIPYGLGVYVACRALIPYSAPHFCLHFPTHEVYLEGDIA